MRYDYDDRDESRWYSVSIQVVFLVLAGCLVLVGFSASKTSPDYAPNINHSVTSYLSLQQHTTTDTPTATAANLIDAMNTHVRDVDRLFREWERVQILIAQTKGASIAYLSTLNRIYTLLPFCNPNRISPRYLIHLCATEQELSYIIGLLRISVDNSQAELAATRKQLLRTEARHIDSIYACWNDGLSGCDNVEEAAHLRLAGRHPDRAIQLMSFTSFVLANNLEGLRLAGSEWCSSNIGPEAAKLDSSLEKARLTVRGLVQGAMNLDWAFLSMPRSGVSEKSQPEISQPSHQDTASDPRR
ncbi:hypothetical protein BDV96DRAFT_607698 [Lophiotrema nucula]|uniref:Uncharacterized protein n=1 Tax=Lophiotrema nucula TaxID=690887 RepID=A0A6A5YIK6_9PLEO|nr:hypothetical protein BDV96DRAFT_607698 [Lophiotrema nucula]